MLNCFLKTEKYFCIFYNFSTLGWLGNWNCSSRKTRTCLPYIVNITVADDLTQQEARAPTAITDGKLTLAWCHPATGHNLSRCWTRSLLPHDTTSPQWLTHWGRDKMAAIFQTTFSNAFSWMKMFKFRLRFHWILFPRVQLTVFLHWFR